MSTYYSTGFTGGGGANLEGFESWTRIGANSATRDNAAIIGGSGERTYSDGQTPGTADCSIQTTLTNLATSSAGLLIRAVDIDNYYWGYRDSNDQYWTIDQNNAGSVSNVAIQFESGVSAPITLILTVNSGQGLALYNGATLKTSGTGTRSGTSGTGGIRGIYGAGVTLDDYIAIDSSGGGGGGSTFSPRISLLGVGR